MNVYAKIEIKLLVALVNGGLVGLNTVAYERLKKMILDGDFPMGARMLETKLAPLLSMSRTPIREALQQLLFEGMLEEDEHGITTKHYTHEQILEVYDCRALLESEAVKLIAEARVTTESKQLMRDAIAACESVLRKFDTAANQAELRRAFLQQNNIFHTALYECCPNKTLLNLLRRTERLPEPIRNYASFSKDQILASHLGHKQILYAIEVHDGERAAALMREHIWSARDRMDPSSYEASRKAELPDVDNRICQQA